MRRAADGDERAHSELLHVLAFEHVDLEAELFAELLGGAGQELRRTDIAGHIPDVLRQRDAFRDGQPETMGAGEGGRERLRTSSKTSRAPRRGPLAASAPEPGR